MNASSTDSSPPTPSFAVERIDHLVFRVRDLEASVAFYEADHLCLRVEPFDERAIVRHLAARGVEPKGPASTNFGAEGDGLSLYFSDPDGNVIELKGPATPGA